tara:strand:- start:2372 stop:3616 length:1245 start_codon:yes stop_codon:yes gene_type:complete
MPGITTAEIQRTNGNANYSIHSDIKISDYINNYIRNGRIEFPRWQRDETWPEGYRPTLIESIMGRSDLPKLYLSKNPNDSFYLLDGGHRTRAIRGYMDNAYPITIDGDKVYYDETPSQNTRNNRVMTDYERNVFDRYLLTITIYENLTENEARTKFNRLQNAQPMGMGDVINSHQSDLVDYLRSLGTLSINGQHLSSYFDNYKKVLVKSGNSHMLYQLAAWFTVCFPMVVQGEDRIDRSLDHALRGEQKDTSTTYKYIEAHNEEISDEQKEFFERQISDLIVQIYEFKENAKHLSIAEWTSILHANIYIENFSIEKFINFHNEMERYGNLDKDSKNHAKANNYELAQQCSNQANALNTTYDNKLSEWKKLKSNSNKNGMVVRYDTMNEFCINDDDNIVEQVDHVDDFQPLPVMS